MRWKGKGGIYDRFIKRLIDIVCALLAMIVFCWLYAILAIIVRIKMGTPVIFHQERPGKIDSQTGKEKIFNLCKFRSMTDAKDADGNLLPDAERLPKFGKLLRATSLDELPEAWNILKGDMSVVGPRPLLVKYLDHYNEREHQRHDVRPGLSGWAQVNGRNTVTWKSKFEYDVYYAENVSFLLDAKIVFMSVKNMFSHEGIDFVGQGSIAEYFESNDRI